MDWLVCRPDNSHAEIEDLDSRLHEAARPSYVAYSNWNIGIPDRNNLIRGELNQSTLAGKEDSLRRIWGRWSPQWRRFTLFCAALALVLIAWMSTSDDKVFLTILAVVLAIGFVLYLLAYVGFNYNNNETHRQRPEHLE